MSDQTIEIEDDAPEVEILPEAGEGGAEATEASRKEEPAGEVDGVDRLKANLDAEKRRADEAERRAKQAETARRQDAEKHQAGSIDGQIALITAERSKAQSTLEYLMERRTQALQSGDYAAESKLTLQMTREQAKIAQFDGGLYQLNEAKQAPQQRQQPQHREEAAPQDRTEAFIRGNGLAPKVASFIRENPGFVGTDRSIRRLADAHEDALAEGHGDQSEGYFAFVRKAMGAGKPATASAEMPTAPQRRPQMAAPPSRSSSEVVRGKPKLELSKAEFENAKQIGVNVNDKVQLASYARDLAKVKREGAR
jgi:hypothetical protein